jgi:hypothetical protein
MNKKLIFVVMLVCVLTLGFLFLSCDNGNGGHDPTGIEWSTWVDTDTALTVDIEEQTGGVAKVTVSGTPVAEEWERWKAQAIYANHDQELEQDKYYFFTIEMWTASGTRNVSMDYYQDFDKEIFLVLPDVSITTERKTFELESSTPIPKTKSVQFIFHCGDTIGTFYIKIISIVEAPTPNTLKIINIDSQIITNMGEGGWGEIFLLPPWSKENYSYEDIVAGAWDGAPYWLISLSESAGSFTATVPLFVITRGYDEVEQTYWNSLGKGWTGAGTYDVYLHFSGDGFRESYRKKNVDFFSSVTIVDANTFEPLE